MKLSDSQTLTKAERITSKLLIDRLFEGGNASIIVFPFRVVYMTVPKNEVPVSILISVPKKRFHNAVDRNKMKRLVREAYRTQKHILRKEFENRENNLAIAFICITSRLCKYETVHKSINKALNGIIKNL